jgi:tripartite-type tricarboxylate transporter receptor subunit TctC
MIKKSLALAAIVVSITGAAHAAWPDKPIRIVTGAAPGSGLDSITRAVAQGLRDALGQPVIVENKPGANQLIAAEACANSKPDGYTFCTSSTEPYTSNYYLFKKLPYDAINGFAPIAIMTALQTGVVARADIGARTLKDVVAISRAKPGSLFWGSYGQGSNSHLYLEAIRKETGWDVIHVPFKSTPETLQALLGNQVQMIYNVLDANVRQQVEAQKLVVLAYAGAKRSPDFPNVPTFDELGVGRYLIRGWWGMVAPAGVPEEIVNTMNRTVLAIVNKPEFRATLKATSTEPFGPNTPAEMAANIKRNREIAEVALKLANVQPN